MSSQEIVRFAWRRMLLLHLPVIGVLLLVSLLASRLDNGVAALAGLLAGIFVMVALLDWVKSELAATDAA